MSKADDYQGFRWAKPECDRHFKLLPREIVAVERDDDLQPGPWTTLSYAAKAVLPVLLRHTDMQGIARPGEGRIAAMAGLTRKTARGAARELEERELLTIRSRTSRAGRRCKNYLLTPSDAGGITMPSIFIDGGLWAEVRPAARALAVAFRFFAKPRPDLDPGEGQWLEGEDFEEYLGNRKADYCNADPAVLRDFAGIGPRVYLDAIQDLKREHFIEPDLDRPDYWRVMVWPPYVKKVSYLNAKLEGE